MLKKHNMYTVFAVDNVIVFDNSTSKKAICRGLVIILPVMIISVI